MVRGAGHIRIVCQQGNKLGKSDIQTQETSNSNTNGVNTVWSKCVQGEVEVPSAKIVNTDITAVCLSV